MQGQRCAYGFNLCATRLFGVRLNGVCRCSAGNEDFNDCIATQAVATMDATRYFARSIQTGNNVSFSIQHMPFRIPETPPMVWCVEGAIMRIRSVVFSRS